jgi:hypothetical protein
MTKGLSLCGSEYDRGEDPMFVPSAQLDEKTRVKMECKRCGHSWFRKDDEGPAICPECNAPCEDKEHCNVNRKN